MELTGHRRPCKQLCRGMVIPCRLMFSCSNKVKINHLKELVESKIRGFYIYINNFIKFCHFTINLHINN